ncbi:uncharacterized protein LOC120412850 [Culex pipiens pallens]|uniref:uncharacterized protein LOC120412850 n=1 Tax=Culex pipiens pallens TaxID=42434 RepID=UPI00195497A7|nr:uncharacterized protein LOC120412850 [Culex pipiens pallens]
MFRLSDWNLPQNVLRHLPKHESEEEWDFIVVFVTSSPFGKDGLSPNDDGSDSRTRNTVSRRTDKDGLSYAYANYSSTVASSRTRDYPIFHETGVRCSAAYFTDGQSG